MNNVARDTLLKNHLDNQTTVSWNWLHQPKWVTAVGNDDFLSIPNQLTHGSLEDPLLRLFLYIRDLNLSVFDSVEGSTFITPKPWEKPQGASLEGGGVMAVGRAKHLEKCAVNMSLVAGKSYPSLESQYAGQPFVAGGVSLICHPFNPHAPIAHMNIRVLRVGHGEGAVTWMGGGADLTPCVKYDDDTDLFHGLLKEACQKHPKGNYAEFKQQCDDYFFIPHRGDTRGVGGVFFDYLSFEDASDCGLLLEIGQHFAFAYHTILKRRVHIAFDEALKEKHLYWRGRYAEFNLAYDRGTRFGLMTGGNTEAIFASLPPVVKW